MNPVLGILLISMPFCIGLSATSVKIEDKGYSGLVIAINPDIEESEQLIAAIKETWTNASRDLYIATQNLAYFKQITILVPKSWNGTNADPVKGNENYDQADVVIALPNPSFGNEPYTQQHGGCGERGIRSHFTPDFLLSEESVQNYGPRGKVVVHEWAHYRWGVFDETSKDNPFYWDPNYDGSNGPEATRCPNTLYGEVRDVESTNAERRCSLIDLDQATDSYPSNCVFFPFEEQFYHPNTSIMCYQYMDEITTFCHDGNDNDERNIHNIYAPNDQNRLCGLRSTWTVIMDSLDFRDTIPAAGIHVDSTIPVFEIVRPQGQRFVLVLDKSGSMNGWKLEALRKSAYQFITVSAPTGSWVGIVQFDYSATIRSQLVQLDSDETREDMAKNLPTAAGGGTCIGCGIDSGISVLEVFGIPAGGHLVVITDGEGYDVEIVYSEVLNKGIIIDTVYIETNANEILTNLTEESGGVWYYTKNGNDLQDIFNDISSTDSTESNSYQLHSEHFSLAYGESFTSVVAIDKTIGLDTIFVFTYSQTDVPTFYVQTPSGCFYTNNATSTAQCPDGSIHNVTESFKTIKFHIPGVAEVGEWIYTALSYSTPEQKLTSVVTSVAANNNIQPILVESGMSQTTVTEGSATVVYAKVTQGYNPVLGATVIATVTRPTGDPVVMDLYDNGAGADIRTNDGIYSRYFTQYSGEGRYSVEVEVGHKNSTSSRKSTTKQTMDRSRANYRPGLISSDGSTAVNPNGASPPEVSESAAGGIQSEDIGEFSRVVSSGAFSYKGSDVTTDTFPPGQITDAMLQQRDLEDPNKGVIITFTSTGEDLDSGTADRYDLRYTYDDPLSLSLNFNNNTKVLQSNLLQGNLSNPLPAGSLEAFTFQTPELPEGKDTVKLAVAIRAVDDTGNAGDPSNIALTNFFIKPLEIPTTPAPTTIAKTTIKTTTTKRTTKASTCSYCEACDPNTSLYMILMATFAITTGAFLTSTVILSVWLGKVNKQRKTNERPHVIGVDNLFELNERKQRPRRENKVVPVVATSASDGRPVVAYVEESDVHREVVYPQSRYNDYEY